MQQTVTSHYWVLPFSAKILCDSTSDSISVQLYTGLRHIQQLKGVKFICSFCLCLISDNVNGSADSDDKR